MRPRMISIIFLFMLYSLFFENSFAQEERGWGDPVTAMQKLKSGPSRPCDILIHLSYPQLFNAPKKQHRRIEQSHKVKGPVYVDIDGIMPAQKGKAGVIIEYYLDKDLLFTRDFTGSGTTTGFVLDTLAYPDGKHKLIVNLWDMNGNPAIGMREIIISNNKKSDEE